MGFMDTLFAACLSLVCKGWGNAASRDGEDARRTRFGTGKSEGNAVLG